MLCRHNLLAAALLLFALAPSIRAEEAIQWAPNLPAAVNMASRQNQLVLIHFWAPNCPPCRALEQNVFTRPDVAQAIQRDFVPVKINAAAMPDTAKKYGVDRWPMDVIITPAGYALHSTVSPQDPREYMQVIGSVAAQRQPGRNLTAAAAATATTTNPDRSGGWGEQPQQYQQQQPRADQGQYGSQFSQAPQGQQSRFAADESRWQNQRPPQGNAAPADRWGGQQQAQYGAEYANNYAAEQAAQPRQDQYKPQGGAAADGRWQDQPAANGQQSQFSRYGQQQNGPQQYDDRGGNPAAEQPRPRQTTNPYMDGRGGESMRPENPATRQSQPQVERQPQGPAAGGPPLALDGYCPVTLVNDNKWTQGDKRFGIIHRGQLYLFTSEAQKQQFWKDPDLYAPILSGSDPVAFAESGQSIAGSRRHGVFFRNQIYLFTSEQSLEKFWAAPQRYADIAHQAMRGDAGQQRR